MQDSLSVNDELRVQKKLIFDNFSILLSHIIVKYLDRAIFQWICGYKSLLSDDALYLTAIFDSCLFSLLNVYASQCGVLLFHNKHLTQFLGNIGFYANTGIQNRIETVIECRQLSRPYSQKFETLGLLICLEAQKYFSQLKNNNYFHVFMKLFNPRGEHSLNCL